MFAGISHIGLEEISQEDSSVDANLNLKTGESGLIETLRPEFDVTRAYNPRSTLLAVARVGGMSFTALGTDGALLSGQGGVMRLDGGYEPIAGKRVPFISIGAGKLGQSGSSRAAQFMLLEQAFNEAKAPTPGDERLLTGQGRNALNQAMASQRFMVSVNREADIRQVLKLAQKYGIRVALVGASEAWRVADQLAAANIPVFIDAMEALPSSFDQIGSYGRQRRAPETCRRVGQLHQRQRRLAQRPQGPADRRQCGRQRPAVGSGPGRHHLGAGQSPGRRRPGRQH